MSRTYRALTTLALSLALVAATAAVAAAAPSAEDQNDRLLRNLEAAHAQRTQAGRDVDLIAVALLALIGGAA
jgi:hypothetical protein